MKLPLSKGREKLVGVESEIRFGNDGMGGYFMAHGASATPSGGAVL